MTLAERFIFRLNDARPALASVLVGAAACCAEGICATRARRHRPAPHGDVCLRAASRFSRASARLTSAIRRATGSSACPGADSSFASISHCGHHQQEERALVEQLVGLALGASIFDRDSGQGNEGIFIQNRADRSPRNTPKCGVSVGGSARTMPDEIARKALISETLTGRWRASMDREVVPERTQ